MMCPSEVKQKPEGRRRRRRKCDKSSAEEVMQLKNRLTHLEEETNMMKQEMLQNRAERKTMLNHVYHQLKCIHFSLHPQNQTFGCKFCKEGGMKDGLCQVLYEDLKPSVLFIRGSLGANSVAGHGSGESKMANMLCIECNK